MKKIVLMCTLTVFFAGLCAAQNSKIQEKIQEGISYHNQAQNESDGLIKKCMETLKPFIETDVIARAYYGSAITVSAGYCSESSPIKSLELLETGSRFIDEAVAKEPDNLAVHILRLENGLEVSRLSPYKRYSVIKDDIKFLLKDGTLNNLDPEMAASVYYYCGLYRIEESDIDSALDLFDLSIASCPKSDWAKLSQKMLNRYEE